MSRYTDATKVKLALNAPTGVPGAASWTGNTYDDFISGAIAMAEKNVDDMCSGWAPFTAVASSVAASVRTFTPTYGELDYFAVLDTDPFIALPTAITVDGTAIDFTYDAYVPIARHGSGKGLVSTGDDSWREGTKYSVTARWGFSEVPDDIVFAATRMATRYFQDLRNNMGLLEVGEGVVYSPKSDPIVMRWLSPYTPWGIV